ncbi:MAG: cysteine-rich CWC family protein [Piscirickettsiaceae bacterium]|nr:cysteine-rich CWC family protein [Piscirickettsiaceae bacterium]
MVVNKTLDESICPFCQSQNSCTANTVTSCWCNNAKVPQGLHDLLPLELQDRVCICSDCITHFNEDKMAFTLKFS